MMLERMDLFFENRLSGYDEHMLTEIECADKFYRYTASLLPREDNAVVLDLGCGTGLELEEYFICNPNANVTGIDVSKKMLETLVAKFPDKNLNLICGSYFDVEFGIEQYHAAVSVESLHHFASEQKLALYQNLLRALKPNGYFVLTDYFAESDTQEKEYFETFKRMKQEQGITDDELYHFDTPLTVEHEISILKQAGFSDVQALKNWGATFTIIAKR